MGWRIIDIEKNCFIKLFLNNLIITGNQRISIPLGDIDVILFDNNKINVSIYLLNELANQNICVIFCDSSHLPSSMLLPFIGNLTTLKVLEKQINWTSNFKEKLWRKIFTLKTSNQINYLKHLNLISNQEEIDLKKWQNEFTGLDQTNREGHIAKFYWVKLLGTNFNRQDDHLIINNILNYGYTIINSMVARSIVKKGLDCRISIFHRSVWNQFALASDFIEPFRIVVDILVFELLKNKIIDLSEVFLSVDLKDIILDFIANFKFKINGLFQQLNNGIDDFIDSIVNDDFNDLTIEYDFEVKVETEQESD